jgi:hypothetical protein
LALSFGWDPHTFAKPIFMRRCACVRSEPTANRVMDLCARISFLWFLLTAEFRAVLWKKKNPSRQKFKQKRISALGA